MWDIALRSIQTTIVVATRPRKKLTILYLKGRFGVCDTLILLSCLDALARNPTNAHAPSTVTIASVQTAYFAPRPKPDFLRQCGVTFFVLDPTPGRTTISTEIATNRRTQHTSWCVRTGLLRQMLTLWTRDGLSSVGPCGRSVLLTRSSSMSLRAKSVAETTSVAARVLFSTVAQPIGLPLKFDRGLTTYAPTMARQTRTNCWANSLPTCAMANLTRRCQA